MPNIVKNLLLSKKFVVALLTGGGAVAMYFGWNVDPTKILVVISPFLAYIGAQGWADSGKEQALVNQATALQQQAMAQEHEVKMAALRPPGLLNSAAAPAPAKPEPSGDDKVALMKAALPGFAGLELMLVVATLGLIALCFVAGLGFVAPASGAVVVAAVTLASRWRRRRARSVAVAAVGVALCVVVGCAHPVQTTLGVGQCVLDNGVLADVVHALGQDDYVHAVEAVALKDAAELVDCALLAVASPQPGTGSAAVAARTAPADTLAQRAREVLAARRAAGR